MIHTYNLTKDMSLDEIFADAGCGIGDSLVINGNAQAKVTHGRPRLAFIRFSQCHIISDNDRHGFLWGHDGLNTLVEIDSCLIEGVGDPQHAQADPFRNVKIGGIDGCLWKNLPAGPVSPEFVGTCTFVNIRGRVLNGMSPLEDCRFEDCIYLVNPNLVSPNQHSVTWHNVRSNGGIIMLVEPCPQKRHFSMCHFGWDSSVDIGNEVESITFRGCTIGRLNLWENIEFTKRDENARKPLLFQDCDFVAIDVNHPDGNKLLETHCTFLRCTLPSTAPYVPEGCTLRPSYY